MEPRTEMVNLQVFAGAAWCSSMWSLCYGQYSGAQGGGHLPPWSACKQYPLSSPTTEIIEMPCLHLQQLNIAFNAINLRFVLSRASSTWSVNHEKKSILHNFSITCYVGSSQGAHHGELSWIGGAVHQYVLWSLTPSWSSSTHCYHKLYCQAFLPWTSLLCFGCWFCDVI